MEHFSEGNKLSRVWQVASDPDRVFAILTAFRGENARSENLQRNAELAADLRASGLGMFVVDGFWVENPKTPHENHVSEDAYFVSAPLGSPEADRFESAILKLVQKYSQEAAIVKLDGDEEVSLLFQNGSRESVGAFHPNRIAQAYTRLRKTGKTFVFESASTPMGYGRALADKLLREAAR